MVSRFTRIAYVGRTTLLAASALVVGCSGDAEETEEKPAVEQAAHLVIDSGSSGTRFCLFTVERSTAASASKRCAVGGSEPICGKSDGGLAKITDGKPPSDVAGLIAPNLEGAWSKLEAKIREVGGDTAVLNQIGYAAALGTGGYRDPTTAAPAKNPAWDAVWEAIQEFLTGRGVETVVAEPILGEDEGKLAWRGVFEAKAPEAEFAIIEIGGATLQLAAGAPDDTYAALKASSVYRGQNYMFDALLGDPAFTACYNPTDKSMQDANACIDFISEKVFAGSALTEVATGVTPRALYGLGPPWSGIFREYPSAPPWPPKTGSDFNPTITLTNLRALAEKVCPLSSEEILAFAPNSYEAKTNSGKECYATSFTAAYFGSLSSVSANGEIMPGGDDQWARGASVSGEYFDDCR